MIQFNEVSKIYPGGNEGVRNVTLQIDSGEFCFLTGHSGAGKSTILHLIGLVERASRGQIFVYGRNLERLPAHEIPYYRRHLGLILQGQRLLADRTVFDNVALPLLVAGTRHSEIGKRVRAALDKVSLLRKERLVPAMLSVGEQQRISIARAVVNRPSLLLADEPTGNLDPELAQEILGLFDQFNQIGVTVLIATHDASLLDLKRRRVIELRQGQLQVETP